MSDDNPTKACAKCCKECAKSEYAKRQWRRDDPTCRSCAAEADEEEQKNNPTKTCSQCNKECEKDQFPKKQWKKEHPLCRVCFEYTNISQEQTRECKECKLVQPRNQYNIDQWGKGEGNALCNGCRDLLQQRCLASMERGPPKTKELPDGTLVCATHSLERCDICMMSFTLPNQYQRKRNELGRDLTKEEYEEETRICNEADGVHINRKICIMDGQILQTGRPCPRTGRKFRCPCGEVTYCSKDCQVHHWQIHKMTCKVQLEKEEKKRKKKAENKVKAAQLSAQTSHGLTEDQLNYIRGEALMAENSAKGSIDECAWQLGEHPLVIGGGSVHMQRDGRHEFIKGDVAKIYREKVGAEWDGSPRFGLGEYVQQKTPFDWIAKAREGRSQREKDLARELGLPGY